MSVWKHITTLSPGWMSLTCAVAGAWSFWHARPLKDGGYVRESGWARWGGIILLILAAFLIIANIFL